MTSRPMLACLLCAACGVPAPGAELETGARTVEVAAPSADRVTLTLEARGGEGNLGWSFAQGRLVEGPLADVVVSSNDCGARGRWVFLQGHGVELCSRDHGCSTSFQVGGSDGDFTGHLTVMRGQEKLGTLFVAHVSPTPQGWYEQSPIAPFDVVVDLVR